MNQEIGPILRDARIRRKIDLADVEAETKIRVRYLRALENDEWDVLPGGAYTRSFIRTYANHLGLDGERLADEYRRRVEDPLGPGYPRAEPVTPAASRASRPPIGARLQVSRGALAVLISVGLIVLLIGIGLAGGGGDGGGEETPAISGQGKGAPPAGSGKHTAATNRASLRLTAIADVWVCLLDAKQEPVINGQILAAGAEEGPFRSKRFTVSFGNGEVEIEVNGEEVGIEDTPNPIGYEISPSGKLRLLSEAERPTCI